MSKPRILPLHARRYGDAGGHASPLLFLHGLLGSGTNWHTQAQRLATKREILVPDLRNHGRSPHSPETGYDAMVSDLLALLVREGLGRVTLVGHSMGGKLAMLAALRAPQCVERLVVVDIAPVRYPNRYEAIFATLGSLDLAALKSRREADRQLEDCLPDPTLRQFLLQNLVKEDKGWVWRVNLPALAEQAEQLMGFEPLAGLEPFRGPVLVIYGGASDYVSETHAETFRQWFPAARLECVEGAGHWVHAERPDDFQQALDAFIDAD
jgi:pimeloyl-ACP methyl ester carboxylesterase